MATSTHGVKVRPDTPFEADPDRQKRFLDYIADAHSVKAAAKFVGINRQSAYNLRLSNPTFAAAWDEAVKTRGDWWEDQLRFVADSAKRKRPDTLGIIIGLKKEGRFVEPQYAAKLNLNVNVNLPFQDYTADQLRVLIAKLDAQIEAGQRVVEGQIVEAQALPEAGEPDTDST